MSEAAQGRGLLDALMASPKMSYLLEESWPSRAVQGILGALSLPGDAYAGKVDPMSDEGIGRATDLAGMMIVGGAEWGVPRGALGSAPSRPGPYLPDTPPASLRDRYKSQIYAATGPKDHRRVKLTPQRMEVARQSLRDSFDMRADFIPREGAYRQTPQIRQAIEFAEEAKRSGHKVSLRTPDGPHGSIYVRVGDKGSVRFSDHPAPMEDGRVVGGYSKTLRRRHHPADLSVAPQDASLSDALNWLLEK